MTDLGFPVDLAVRGRRCVIIGGGAEAVPRVRRLARAAADTHVVTPAPCAELDALAGGPVTLHRRTWRRSDLDGATVVIATREDPLDADALYAAGRDAGALVRVLDDAWGELTDGAPATAHPAGRHGVHLRAVHDATTAPSGGDDGTPVVHLVGAGPGDPELLTVRAARLLREADLIVHDQLVPAAVLRHARADAEVVPAGRRCGEVVLAHPAVIERLASGALAGQRVVRLKGGDPVVFGRGGEETLALAARGVATELVPGISSAIAAPELAGIPLTHRGTAAGFLVLTGRRRRGDDGLGPDWDLAARFSGTVVVLMGGERLADLTGALVARGRAADTPAAVVAHAGRPEQMVVRGQLATIATEAAEMSTPAVLIVGDVVDVLAVQHVGSIAPSERIVRPPTTPTASADGGPAVVPSGPR